MLTKVKSAAFNGIEVVGVNVEVNVASKGFPGFEIVGLPSKTVAESKERVKTALVNSGINFPSDKKIIVNLAPADLPKEGSLYDLPIAVGIMALVKGLEVPQNSVFFGELSLDGTLRHTKGAFLFALYTKENGLSNLYIPSDCFNEAKVVKGISVYGVSCLQDLASYLSNGVLEACKWKKSDKLPEPLLSSVSCRDVDFCEIKGQAQAKRALEISAAGGHNLFMTGPPGVGKSMLAKAFVSILAPLGWEESLEVTKIYSVSGNIPPNGSLVTKRPFRAPHHTVSYSGLLGGGQIPRPGEVSLAHRGVLFLDEFAEFPKFLIDSLRQPIEDGFVTVSRNRGYARFPSRFLLLAASNPCPCGYKGFNEKNCKCTPGEVERYRRKVSGPILDRFDLFISVSTVDVDNLKFSLHEGFTRNVDNSEDIRQRVVKAREVQLKRLSDYGIFCNSDMSNKEVARFCALSDDAEQLMRKAFVRFGLSVRAYYKVIKVGRTIADLDHSADIKAEHLAEALQYRGGFE